MPVVVGTLPATFGECEELVAHADEGHPRDARLDREVEDAAVELERLVQIADFEGDVVDPDEAGALRHVHILPCSACYNPLVRFLLVAFALLVFLPAAGSTAVATQEVVILTARPGQARALAAEAGRLGGRIEAQLGNQVQVRAPASVLAALSSSAAVSSVRKPLLHVAAEVTGQEVPASGVQGLQSSGVNGRGVSIAIIDIGFAGVSEAQATGDLPAGTGTVVKSCGHGESAHGTAVAEIVHDMAPAAQLYLLCVNSELTLQIAVDFAIDQHIPIISHSITWLSGGRGDGVHNRQDRVSPDTVAKKAYDHGILWVNAAGNYAESHWSGPYSHRPGSVYQDFSSGAEGNTFTIPGTTEGCASLTWDDWPVSDQNFDLYIHQSDTATILASSENVQAPGGLSPPSEEACVGNTSASPLSVYAEIKAIPPANTSRFDLFVTSGKLQYKVPQGSVAQPAESPWVLAVGAVCWLGNSVRLYSSQGPTIDGRVKPDLVAYDGISTRSLGSSSNCSGGFLGTSAATPQVAGAAALVLQQQPGLAFEPSALMAALQARTSHLGGAGRNNLFGAGRLCFSACTPPPPPPPPAPPPAPPPVQLKVTRFLTIPKRSHAGRLLDARIAVVRTDTGARVRSGGVSCKATVGRLRLAVRSARFRSGLAACSWRVPASAAGKMLRGTVGVTFGGSTISRTFSRRVQSG